MMSPLDSGISAISAFLVKMNVTANNIANVNSDGFKKSRATFKEGPSGGVEPNVDQVCMPSRINPDSQNDAVSQIEASDVDLAEEVTTAIATQTGYNANLKTIQAVDEMIGGILDTIG